MVGWGISRPSFRKGGESNIRTSMTAFSPMKVLNLDPSSKIFLNEGLLGMSPCHLEGLHPSHRDSLFMGQDAHLFFPQRGQDSGNGGKMPPGLE